jgi:hypothetical protein
MHPKTKRDRSYRVPLFVYLKKEKTAVDSILAIRRGFCCGLRLLPIFNPPRFILCFLIVAKFIHHKIHTPVVIAGFSVKFTPFLLGL